MHTALRTLGCTAALATALAPASATVPEIKYEFNLSDFDGALPLLGGRLKVDAATGEIFVLEGGLVRIFSGSGMQTYSFVIDIGSAQPVDLAVEPSGDILVAVATAEGPGVLRFDYRGVAKDWVTPVLPDTLGGFRAGALELGPDGLLYLLDSPEFRIVVIRTDGGFVREIDLAPLLGIKDEERPRYGIGGFGLDAAGNMLVTVSEKFLAYAIAPDATVRSFGMPGSAPGRFGVVGAIAADEHGNIFVGDKQRSVVLVFDKNLEFVTEFGGRGDQPGSLVRPQSVRVASGGRIFVGQLAQRGVSVFRVLPTSQPSRQGQEVDGQN